MGDNVARQVNRYPGNKYKAFRSLAEAQEWIKPPSLGTLSPHVWVKYSTSLLVSIPPPNLDESPVLTTPELPAPSKPPSSQAEKPQETGEESGEPGVSLSLEQTLVLNMVKSGGNVFFTGSAGRFHDHTGRIHHLMSQERGSPYC